MKNIYNEVTSLDIRCYDEFLLSEDVLMENASLSITNYVKKYIKNNSILLQNKKQNINQKILIVCGSGNNGADGITVARQLKNRYNDVVILNVIEPKSKMAILQSKRARKIGIKSICSLKEYSQIPFIVIDAIFGSGLKRELNNEILSIIDTINMMDSYKIACDIPTGIKDDGSLCQSVFKADVTITMGALKTQLFNDNVKDLVGKIKIASLGIDDDIYQTSSNMVLLEKSDLRLPNRDKSNSHKGSFGHLLVVSGDKNGASKLAGKSAINFGVGLSTILSKERLDLESALMQCELEQIPSNIGAISIGMGLSDYYTKSELKYILDIKCSKVIDADLFYNDIVLDYLDDEVILTPHPKEFVSLLKMTQIADIDIEELQNFRIKYVKLFCIKFPKVVLLLKGANVIIAQFEKLYINSFGNQSLSKGGMGDVLCGMIGALLAQKYYHNFSLLDCALNASLAHALSAKKYIKKQNNYSLTPNKLIKQLSNLF